MGSTDKKATGNNANVPGVSTVVTVVAKEEVTVRWDLDRSKVTPCRNGRQDLNGPLVSCDPFRLSDSFDGV